MDVWFILCLITVFLVMIINAMVSFLMTLKVKTCEHAKVDEAEKKEEDGLKKVGTHRRC